ncbi:hypothetical protein [Aromatoleum anaerobium]|uniref:Type IV pilus biogenesis protein PilP n=1 Tax=Aromatoleum anaerobium TaxID=182180 RepID=A0ABX1PQJ9_9RHOO|nr:hypothetical protein [Aromatoleum anaerobium]MCK0508620.1 hypothetical protein [Aromatoleum anaerobium]
MNAPSAQAESESMVRLAPRLARIGRNQRPVILALIAALVLAGGVILFVAPEQPAAPAPLPQAQPLEAIGQHTPPIPEFDAPAPADSIGSPRLDQLDERVDALSRTVESIDGQFSEINNRLVSLHQVSDELRVRLEALAQRREPASVPARRAAPARTGTATKTRTPTVVSVDIWGGQPSVAIRDAKGDLAFYREGDTVGVARIQRIDAQARQVHLSLPDGTVTAVGVRH